MIKLPNEASSYWLNRDSGPHYPSLDKHIEVDVVIVGAGITGLTTAYLLKKSGKTVAVVEKGTVASGVSGHTTGKVTSQHNLIYDKLTKRLGQSSAKIYGQANQAALDQIEGIILSEKIDCNWQRRDNYVFTTDPSKVDELQSEAATAQSYGLPAQFTTQTDLPFEISGAVKFSNQAHFHIKDYLIGLARAVDGNGSHVFEHSRVIHMNTLAGCTVRTLNGKINAKNIIVATNVPTIPLMARGTYCIAEYPKQSYIVAGPNKQNIEGMYISPDDNHYSLLPVHHGKDKLLLIGGREHIPLTRFNSEERYQDLATYGEKYFKVKKYSYKWTSRDYLGYDDMPLIGRLYPWSKNIYTATGFMKWGLTNGTMAGMILTDLINAKPNPWADTFDPHRMSTIRSIPKVISENLG